MNKILLTGHKGFLGSYLFKFLKKNKKNKIIGADINLYSNKRKYEENFINIKSKNLKNLDTIIHLAGISTNYDPRENIYKQLSYKSNLYDTLLLAKKAKKAGIKKFIFASSTSVYGDKKNSIVNEKSSLAPTTSYGKSKALIEKKLKKMANGNFQVIILRMVTLFGESKRMRFDLLVNNLVCSYLTKKKIILLSDGKKIRPQIHLKDVVKVYEYFIENEIKQNCLILNVGREELNLKVAQIAKKISNALKCKIEYGKADIDKRSYKVSFERLGKFISFKKNINTIEMTSKKIAKLYRAKKQNYFKNKNFYNLSSVKFLIKNKEIKKLI